MDAHSFDSCWQPIKANGNTRVSGRPLPAGAVGNSREVVLTDGFKYDKTVADYDTNGIDPESLVFDAANKVFWTSDEYGPFIAKIDASTGVILKKYEPGTQLPAVLAKRRANRGMEGLAMFGGLCTAFCKVPLTRWTALASRWRWWITPTRTKTASAGERPMRLWLIKLPRELRSYPVN